MSFTHFILRFNKISLLYKYPGKGDRGAESRPKDKVETG
jgi:hypothetical protein